ncbi:MAG: hypothetical protein BAJALOKI2v1_320040 [Promethearchaeota archaeon]|nr:MAG: hypothetical protein BAJALOKI2v1_320040 [Candidatus Lokiarchaeota archaeon]
MLIYHENRNETFLLKRDSNNNISLFLGNNREEPIAKLSVDANNSELNSDEIILKDYSENSLIIEELLASNMLKTTDRFILVGNRLCPVCKVLV